MFQEGCCVGVGEWWEIEVVEVEIYFKVKDYTVRSAF